MRQTVAEIWIVAAVFALLVASLVSAHPIVCVHLLNPGLHSKPCIRVYISIFKEKISIRDYDTTPFDGITHTPCVFPVGVIYSICLFYCARTIWNALNSFQMLMVAQLTMDSY